MKLRKILSIATASVMALGMMSMAASAEDVTDPDPTPTETVKVLCDTAIAQGSSVEFTPAQLGKGIDGAKIRFTYTSGTITSADDQKVVGIAGKKNDDSWSWMQSATNPALEATESDTTYTVDMTYAELVEKADINEADVRCYVFANWHMKADTNLKIELVTPYVEYYSMTLYDGVIKSGDVTPEETVEITPADLGKGSAGARVEITYTSDVDKDWVALGIAGKAKDTWTWTSANKGLLSEGKGVTTTANLSYADFVAAAGIGDDLECFVLQNWGLEADSNVKVELLLPFVDGKATKTLYSGELAEDEFVEFTPDQLGENVPNSKIEIDYVGAGEKDEAAIGICANGGTESTWYTGTNNIASIGPNEPNRYVATFAQFEEFAGIPAGATFNTYVFQNWGLAVGEPLTINLVIYNGPITEEPAE